MLTLNDVFPNRFCGAKRSYVYRLSGQSELEVKGPFLDKIDAADLIPAPQRQTNFISSALLIRLFSLDRNIPTTMGLIANKF